MYTTVVSRVVPAGRPAVWAVLTEARALAGWRVPTGCAAGCTSWDRSPAARIRMTPTYDDPAALGRLARLVG
jgi:uncharacterized protein YndB with AHSA1/START domain